MYHKIDVHIGRRLRERRVALGMSQAQLAKRLGISFQQVQKYESGSNRISGSRLWDIANILEVPVEYFFEDLERDSVFGDTPSLASDRRTIELARSIDAIEDEEVKAQLVRLVKSFSRAINPS